MDTRAKVILFTLAVLFLGCGTTDSDTNMDDEDDDTQSEFITYSPPEDNRATLVASFPLVDESRADSVYIRDLWGFKIDMEKYVAVGSSIESDSGLIDFTLHIINVSDPDNPVQASIMEGINAQDIKFWDHYLYTVNGRHEDEGGRIIDVSDPSSPVLSGNFESAHNIFIDQDGLLYLTGSPTRVFSLSDPENPALITSIENVDSHDLTVEDDKLYTFNGRTNPNVSIYDVGTGGNPVFNSGFSSEDIFYSHSGWPTVDGNYLFVADEYAIDNEADFTVWDLTGDTPTLVNGFSDANATAHNIMIRGDFAYVSYYSAGFRIFDISDPENPTLIGEIDTSPYEGETVIERTSGDGFLSISIVVRGAWGIFSKFNDGYAYVSDVNTGLHIIKID